MGDINPTSVDVVKQYEAALLEAERGGAYICAIILASPHDPPGRLYDVAAPEAYPKLCSKYNIHLIGDEVYAKAIFPSQDAPEFPPSVSILPLDIEKLIGPSPVHVLYRHEQGLVCQRNVGWGYYLAVQPLAYDSAGGVASFTRTSPIAENARLNVLEDGEWPRIVFPRFAAKMTVTYDYYAQALKQPQLLCSFDWVCQGI